jgi:signal transduction histidine kinase
MPETIRTANERLRSRPRRGGFLAAFVIATSFLTFGTPARAEADVLGALLHQDAGRLYLIAGLVIFGLLAVAVLQRRLRSMRADSAPLDEVVELRSEADRLKTLLLSEPQVLVEWAAASDEPNILGDTSIFVPGERAERVLAFGAWLTPASAQSIEHAVETLRGEGRGFVVTLTTARGNPVKAQGRAIGGRAVLRLRDLGGIEHELIDLTARYEGLTGEVATMTSLLDSLPTPVWARDTDGRLAFVNAAYARAVDAADSADAVGRNLELLDRPAREQIAEQRAANESMAARLPAIVAGRRRIFDVIVSPAAAGSAGIAIDRTEAEAMRAELGRMIEAHRRVLDQVATGVAIFDVDRKLIFYNAAFRSLFELDAAWLDQVPTDSALLDTLRTARKLPEEQDFRLWKQQLYEAYRAVEPREHMWHLPNGRTLRVVTTPNPEGGVTYLYDDVTERLDLSRRYEALIKVQSETLDHLAEAVAVFGSDGRVRLHNPAFQRMWKLNAETLNEHPHVDSVTAWCQALHDESNVWRALRAAVTAIDEREPIVEPIDRRDGTTINLATMPLPDGATLVTFQDVTDTVNVERALRERNEALEAADGIKIGFVHNVSYELRSPLTNIIGFANLLDDPAFGPLTAKQHEYLGYITSSTNALLAIINNILDLATIDAGAMTLNLGEVDIRACMEAAAEGVQDRLVKDGLRLEIQTPPAIGSFTADERRLRQILFNLLSNAVGFSPPGGAIVLAAIRAPDAVVFSVADNGPGIPPEAMGKVFDWFESDPRGSQHRGPGLGLTLVRSFVELHGGTVTIDSAPSQGTTVTCVFPQEHSLNRTAA